MHPTERGSDLHDARSKPIDYKEISNFVVRVYAKVVVNPIIQYNYCHTTMKLRFLYSSIKETTNCEGGYTYVRKLSKFEAIKSPIRPFYSLHMFALDGTTYGLRKYSSVYFIYFQRRSLLRKLSIPNSFFVLHYIYLDGSLWCGAFYSKVVQKEGYIAMSI